MYCRHFCKQVLFHSHGGPVPCVRLVCDGSSTHNKCLTYSVEGGRAVAAWLAGSVRTAGFPLLTGLEAALAFAAGTPLTGGFDPFPSMGAGALSLASFASRMGTTN